MLGVLAKWFFRGLTGVLLLALLGLVGALVLTPQGRGLVRDTLLEWREKRLAWQEEEKKHLITVPPDQIIFYDDPRYRDEDWAEKHWVGRLEGYETDKEGHLTALYVSDLGDAFKNKPVYRVRIPYGYFIRVRSKDAPGFANVPGGEAGLYRRKADCLDIGKLVYIYPGEKEYAQVGIIQP